MEELQITEQELGKTIKKRKKWSAPGIHRISSFRWKALRSTWGKLATVMQAWIEDPNKVPKWLTPGRKVLIPKTEDLSSEKDYRSITCLNTSCKISTGMLAQHVQKHVVKNDLWDICQMGTSKKVLGAVDKLFLDNGIMGEVRDHHGNWAVAYCNYQKACDMIHPDWMLIVYEWKEIEEVMKKWKKCGYTLRRDFYKVIHRLDSVAWRKQ